MINVQLDEKEIKEIYKQKLDEKMKELESEMVFWDANELKRRTCMSWNFIQQEFFFHPDFKKYKIGTKWYFPAKETKEFLMEWIQDKRC